MRLVDGNAQRLAVHRRGGGEDETLYPVAHHRIEQGERVAEVVAVVLLRFEYGLANLDVRGEVHHAIEAMRGEHAVEQRGVRDTAFYELARQHRLAMAGGEI